MNEGKHRQLMGAGRNLPAIEPPAGFCDKVLRALRQNADGARAAAPASLADQLTLLFPRLATAALVVIVAAAAFDYFADGDFVAQLAAASDQWLWPMDWL